jgi:hypothetical protein
MVVIAHFVNAMLPVENIREQKSPATRRHSSRLLRERVESELRSVSSEALVRKSSKQDERLVSTRESEVKEFFRVPEMASSIYLLVKQLHSTQWRLVQRLRREEPRVG